MRSVFQARRADGRAGAFSGAGGAAPAGGSPGTWRAPPGSSAALPASPPPSGARDPRAPTGASPPCARRGSPWDLALDDVEGLRALVAVADLELHACALLQRAEAIGCDVA